MYESQQELLQAARALANKIASNSPLVVQGTKVALNYADEHNTEDALEHIALWNTSFLQSEDLMEAVSSFLEKRAPVFRNKL